MTESLTDLTATDEQHAILEARGRIIKINAGLATALIRQA